MFYAEGDLTFYYHFCFIFPNPITCVQIVPIQGNEK